jgi:GTP-binding protein
MKRQPALPIVSIVGLPNVGKSTLFNRLIGQRKAIVHKTPGVTRDRNVTETEWGGVQFFLADTGGLMSPDGGGLEEEVEYQVRQAMSDSDLILFLVDGSRTISPVDYDIAGMLRKEECPVLLVANKVERPDDYSAYHSYSAVGLGEPFPVSAQRGLNCGDLLDLIVKSLPVRIEGEKRTEELRIAVTGRPNAGKSSLINRVLGEDRLVVFHEGGTTRDSIDTRFEYNDQHITLIDTAGLRRKSRVDEDLEYFANVRVIRSIERADVVILLIDSEERIVRQDQTILSLVETRGKGVIVAFSKWDLVNGDKDQYREMVREVAPNFSHVPVMFTSSSTGEGLRNLLDVTLRTGESWKRRIRTPVLNKLLGEAVAKLSPPSRGSKPVRLFYISQVGISPPEFVIITNSTKGIKEAYKRYLTNFLREHLELEGIPIRIKFRERKRKTRVRD